MDVELKPCPWCGEKLTGVSVSEGSTFRWRKVDGCCTDGPEVRHNTMADDQAAAEIDSTRRAIEAWNSRHGAGDADRSAELTTAWMAGAERERERAAEDSARLDWLCTGNRKRVEDTITTGWFRVYHDVAPMSADHAEWRAMTEEFYPTTREAIDAARAGERGVS